MMRKVNTLLGLLIFTLMLAGPAMAQGVAKIGVVDLQEVLQNSNAGQAAKEAIQKKGGQMESDLKVKGEEIEKLKQKLEAEMMVMSPEMREEKEREFRIKLNDFKALQKKYRDQLKQEEAKLLKEFQKDIVQLVKEIGQKEGYLMIMEKVGVLYAPQSIDITDKLIKKYNARYGK